MGDSQKQENFRDTERKLREKIARLEKENEISKTMLESSMGTTKAWVNKYNELKNEMQTVVHSPLTNFVELQEAIQDILNKC